MYYNNNKMSKRLGSLTAKLKGLDWKIAVMNAGVGDGFWDMVDSNGEFMEFQNHLHKATVLGAGDRKVDQYFAATVGYDDPEQVASGVDHCSWAPFCMNPNPEPLASIKKAMEKRNYKTNQGFFRKDAYFVPVFITDSDENEDGAGTSARPQQVMDYFNANLKSTMKGLVSFGIFIKPGDTKCFNAGEDILFGSTWGHHYGRTLDAFNKLTGGASYSICDKDYAGNLSSIGDFMKDKISDIVLKNEPAMGTLNITFKPAAPGISWVLDGKKVHFSQALPPGTRVEVSYQTKK